MTSTHQPTAAPARDLTPWLLAAILLLSTLLRLGVALFLGDATPPGKDETSYSTLAMRVASGHGFSFPVAWYPFAPADAPTAHWSFLYTGFAAAVYTLTGWHPLAVRLVSALLSGILMPLVVFFLARRAFPSRSPLSLTVHRSPFTVHHPLSLLAAFLAAIYAYFILYGAMVQTEALFIVALLWSLERALAMEQALRAGQRVRPALVITLGISLGVAALLRQSILPWVAVLGLYLLWTGHRQRRLGPALASLAAAAAITLLFILPFTLRNYAAYGEFLLLNSNAGYAMYSAQHPLHGSSFQEYAAAPLPEDLSALGLNEAQWDKALLGRGIGFVLAEPGRYLLLSLSRVADYFEFWPTRDSSLLFNVGRLISFTLFLPFMLYGLWLSRRDWRRHTLLYLFIFVYSLMHIFGWAMSRYRLPVDAVLLLFAAQGIAALVARLSARGAAGDASAASA